MLGLKGPALYWKSAMLPSSISIVSHSQIIPKLIGTANFTDVKNNKNKQNPKLLQSL